MERQQLPEDFKEFIQCLNSNNVKYLIINKKSTGRLSDLADVEKLEYEAGV
jgi:hypothetical protein